MNHSTQLLIALSLLLLAACSPRLTTLTDDLRQQNNWSEQELEKIQFYLSEDLSLTRERNRGTTAITQGKVQVRNGREIEEVIIRRGTPGVVLFAPKPNQLAIGFDPRDDGKFLVFGSNPKMRGRYTLLAKDWERYSGKVTYDGQTWNVGVASGDVNLLLDLRRKGQTERNVQSPGGRRVGG